MIKHFCLILFSGVWLAVAAQPPEGVPKEAKEVTPGTWRAVDREGKAWLYQKTPFGFQKRAEDSTPKPDVPPPAVQEQGSGPRVTPFGRTSARSAVPVKVSEDGDLVRFERRNPFGVSRWSRRKSELTEEEKKLWEAHAKPASNQTDTK